MLVFNRNFIGSSVSVTHKKVSRDPHIVCNAGYLEICIQVCSSGNNINENPESVEDFHFGVMDCHYGQSTFPTEILDAVYHSVKHRQVRLGVGVFGKAENQISALMDSLSPSHREAICMYFESTSGRYFTYPAFVFLFGGFAGVDIQRTELPQWRYFVRRFFSDSVAACEENYRDRFIDSDFVPTWTESFGSSTNQFFAHSTPFLDFGVAHAKKPNLQFGKKGVWQVLLFCGRSRRRSEEAKQRRKSTRDADHS